MKNTIILATLSLLMFSCSKPDNLNSDCIEKMLSDNDMKEFNGTKYTSGCNNYLSLYKWDGDQYFLYDNPCVDFLTPIVFDCDGNNICNQASNQECSDFFEEAEYIAIVGRSE